MTAHANRTWHPGSAHFKIKHAKKKQHPGAQTVYRKQDDMGPKGRTCSNSSHLRFKSINSALSPCATRYLTTARIAQPTSSIRYLTTAHHTSSIRYLSTEQHTLS
eukprot:3048622-Rhodomonas_salina.1